MINAQEAYQNSLKNMSDVDTTDIIIEAGNRIEESISKDYLTTYVGPIYEMLKAEKAAIELQTNYGYNAGVSGAAPIQQLDGTVKIPYYISLNWKFMPANTREVYK